MITPVAPSVAQAELNVDHHVSAINAYLSTPWSDYDRQTGRWWDAARVSSAEREAIARAFTRAGWNVRHSNDQRDGSALVFKPAGV